MQHNPTIDLPSLPVNGRVLCTPDCSEVQSSHPDTKEKCENTPTPPPPPLCGCVGWVKWLKPKRLSSKPRAQPHSGCATASARPRTPSARAECDYFPCGCSLFALTILRVPDAEKLIPWLHLGRGRNLALIERQ